jgi:intein/homing endonuclease
VAGTKVAVEDGLVVIEEIEKGDLVWAFNESTGEVELYPVLEAFKRTSTYLVLLTVGDEEIITTPEHPFWVEGQGWTPAKGLKQDDLLLNKAGEQISLDKIEIKYKPSQVFNFEVEESHTYYVAQKQVLVHNVCTRQQRSKVYRVHGADTHNIVGGRRNTRTPLRFGYDRPAGRVPIEREQFGLDPGTQFRETLEIQYNHTSQQDIDFADAWLAGTGRTPRNANTEVWHHFHNYNPVTNRGTLYLMSREIHDTISHYGGRWQYSLYH